MDILVDVVNQTLQTATNLTRFVAGTQEFIRFVFNLSDDWDDLLTFAQFTQNGTAYNQYLDDEHSAFLPSEIVEGSCTLTLYGSHQLKRATTNNLLLTIENNILVTDGQSTQPTYEQIISITEDYCSKRRFMTQFASLFIQLYGAEITTLFDGAYTSTLSGYEISKNDFNPNGDDKLIIWINDELLAYGIDYTLSDSGSGTWIIQKTGEDSAGMMLTVQKWKVPQKSSATLSGRLVGTITSNSESKIGILKISNE